MRSLVRSLGQFVAELAHAQHRDQLLVRAGALAYTTLLSIVPLLTVALVTVGRVQPERAALVVSGIAAVLPFSPERVQATLTDFAQRTAALGWIAISISVLVTFNAFYQIEEVFNAIWGVPPRRQWQWRLASFAMMLLWGPLLLAALFSGLYWISSQSWYRHIAWLGRPLPTMLSMVVLTALYRWVPHTRVTWRAALAGAAVAGFAMTAVHLGFQSYLAFSDELNVVYGSLVLLLFFLVSLFLFWFALLLGAEASWVVGRSAPPRRPGALQALIDLLLEIQRAGTLSTDAVVRQLGHTGDDVLARLASTPAILTGDASGWRLARSAEMITLTELRARAGGETSGEGEGDNGVTLALAGKQTDAMDEPGAQSLPPDV